MNAVKNENRAAKNALAFRSFRGHDLWDGGHGHSNIPTGGNGGWSRNDAKRVAKAKRATARAARAASKAVTRAAAAE